MPDYIDLHLQRGAEHLHKLGPRALAEFLREHASRIGGLPAALGLLSEYERRLTPAMICAAGADIFPSSRPRLVPKEARQ